MRQVSKKLKGKRQTVTKYFAISILNWFLKLRCWFSTSIIPAKFSVLPWAAQQPMSPPGSNKKKKKTV